MKSELNHYQSLNSSNSTQATKTSSFLSNKEKMAKKYTIFCHSMIKNISKNFIARVVFVTGFDMYHSVPISQIYSWNCIMSGTKERNFETEQEKGTTKHIKSSELHTASHQLLIGRRHTSVVDIRRLYVSVFFIRPGLANTYVTAVCGWKSVGTLYEWKFVIILEAN